MEVTTKKVTVKCDRCKGIIKPADIISGRSIFVKGKRFEARIIPALAGKISNGDWCPVCCTQLANIIADYLVPTADNLIDEPEEVDEDSYFGDNEAEDSFPDSCDDDLDDIPNEPF